ncbi:hypothetical protein LCGC14_2071270 [marine sediment metagenome]|uniref:Outer membrane protein beta-barrel domain-containing protein n=1 Tax=marine sediment metagenome TaxID=412755 RepID=A0A0F9HFD9_9ZZZZ
MKKVMIFMILFLFFSMTIVFSAGLSLGGTIGGAIGWLSGSDWINTLNSIGGTNSIKLGFYWGIFINIELHEYISIRPEFLYSNQGGAYKYSYMGYIIDGTITAKALEIPIFFNPKIHFSSGYLFLSVGPVLVFFLDDIKFKESGFGMTVETGRSADNPIVFGFAAGIGYEYSFESGNFTFDLKYKKTLTEIFNNNSSFNSIGMQIGFSPKL